MKVYDVYETLTDITLKSVFNSVFSEIDIITQEIWATAVDEELDYEHVKAYFNSPTEAQTLLAAKLGPIWEAAKNSYLRKLYSVTKTQDDVARWTMPIDLDPEDFEGWTWKQGEKL